MTKAKIRIPEMAKANEDMIASAALRVAGHAVAAAHMREHAMVASDYAIQVISLLHSGCLEAVREERMWQIYHLHEIKKTK